MILIKEGMILRQKENGKLWSVIGIDKEKEIAEFRTVVEDDMRMELWRINFLEITLDNFEIVRFGISDIKIGQIRQARSDAQQAIFKAVKELESFGVFVDNIDLQRFYVTGKIHPGLSSVNIVLKL